ncbi:MAG: NMD3-related protein [Candidatus Marsarchaeota archaeon]|nr:NMD3-related protein [Candidatus Marsarchaeota archaeon]
MLVSTSRGSILLSNRGIFERTIYGGRHPRVNRKIGGLIRSTCTNCLIAKNKGYLFELKVRVEGRAMNPRENMYVTEMVESTLNSMEDRNFVHDYSENRDGVDVLLSTRKTVEKLLRRLREEFLGKETKSFKLVGETHDKRRIYKSTFSYRILPLGSGTLLRINSELCTVNNYGRGKLTVSTEAGTKQVFSTSDVFELYKRGRLEVVSQESSFVPDADSSRYA